MSTVYDEDDPREPEYTDAELAEQASRGGSWAERDAAVSELRRRVDHLIEVLGLAEACRRLGITPKP